MTGNGESREGKNTESVRPAQDGDLLTRIVSILEQARGNVVRAVNSNMIMAYWLIGREIVQELQGGEGQFLVEDPRRLEGCKCVGVEDFGPDVAVVA